MKSISSKRQAICDEAKSWLNTPYQHQAMVKHHGVDCAMLNVGVALNTGLIEQDVLKRIPNYPAEWHLHNDVPLLTNIMESFGCVEKQLNKRYPGDIVVFKLGRVPSHLGILVEDNLVVHAFGGSVNKVIINELAAQWEKRLIQVYKFPGM